MESNESAEDSEVALSVIDDVDRNLGYRLSNADARHVGLEWDFAFKLNSSFEIQGVVVWQLALDQQRAG